MKWQALVPTIVAIGAISGLECFAMSKGIDGKVLTLSIAAIAGLGGYKLKDILSLANKKITITTTENEETKDNR